MGGKDLVGMEGDESHNRGGKEGRKEGKRGEEEKARRNDLGTEEREKKRQREIKKGKTEWRWGR